MGGPTKVKRSSLVKQSVRYTAKKVWKIVLHILLLKQMVHSAFESNLFIFFKIERKKGKNVIPLSLFPALAQPLSLPPPQS
jgi:hypothetical protein